MTFQSESGVPDEILNVKRFLPQFFAAFAATLFAISDGMAYAWTSPMVPYLISNVSHIHTEIYEAEWLESAFLYGSLCGIPVTLFFVDMFGRKRSLIIATAAILSAWILIAFASKMAILFIARFHLSVFRCQDQDQILFIWEVFSQDFIFGLIAPCISTGDRNQKCLPSNQIVDSPALSTKKSPRNSKQSNHFSFLSSHIFTFLLTLDLLRFISGIASDMCFISCPMYISEISDRKIRGLLSGMIMVMDHIGAITIYTLGPFTPYYATPIMGSAIVLTELLLLTLVPESPLFLMKKDRESEAREALSFFKSYKNIDNEVRDIKEMLDKQKKQNKTSLKDILWVKSYRKAFFIIIIINVAPQLLGYTAMLMNLHTILESAGSIYMESSLAAILYGAIMFIATIFCCLAVDRFGRKILLTVSAFVSGLCVLSLGVYFHLKQMGFNIVRLSWIPIASVMTFALFFKIGIGIVPVILTAEVAPSAFKALGMGLGDCLMILGSLLAVQLYQFVSKTVGIFLPFYIYCAWAVVLIVFTCFYIPETKGKDLDEIERILGGERVKKSKSISIRL